ncbi:hypothetical protein [Rhodococcus sp. BE178]|uniref:hypothetical protein n=1 Tax=Rhodococcus sp. BE178 TaxID=2817737 RepID=UPI003D1AAD4C
MPNDRRSSASARQVDLGVRVPLLVVVGDLERSGGQVGVVKVAFTSGVKNIFTAHGQHLATEHA